MTRLRSLLLALFGVVVLSGIAPAHAQSKTLVWERLDVDIAVQPNGDLRITETNVIHFTSGRFTFGYRDINQARLTGIRDISVVDETGEPMRTETVVTEKNDYRIKYYFNRPAENEVRRIRVNYTVEGATRFYEGGDQVYWSAVYADRNGFPVLDSRVTVRLPANSDADKVAAYGAKYEVDGAGERTVVFRTLEQIDSGNEFEVRVQFPHGVITGSAPPWQQAFDARRKYDEEVKPANNITTLVVSLLLAIGGPALAAVIWVTRGRDPDVGLVAEYVTEPPSIPAGLGGTLIDESADFRDVVASLFDLASRGVLLLEQGDTKGTEDLSIRRGPNYNAELRPFEQRLIKALRLEDGDDDAVTLGALKNRFYANLEPIRKDLMQDLVDQGLYANNPNHVRSSYSSLAVVLGLVSIVGGCVLTGALADATDFAICLPIGGVLTAVAFFIIAHHMPMRSRKGSDMRMRVEAFKRYMENIEKYVDVKEAKEQFAKYLPWAIAFGLENSWVRKFAAVDAPAPDWYFPYGYGRPYGYGYGRPAAAGGGAVLESPRQGDVSDAARNTRGIGDIERGAAVGMSGLERQFAGMFESVNRTLQSRPAPVITTSSSSGGWSGGGGGFSGGGGGGGGGSGGGGGGFG